MTAPTYDTDLTDITLCEDLTSWSAYGGGGSGLSASPDISMQGTNCVDKSVSGADKGQYFDNGTGITLGTGHHVWVWLFCGTPGLTDTLQNKGASILVGTASNAYCQYHVEGNDTYGAAGRVGRCYPINYALRNTNSSAPYRTATGSPGASPQVFGGGLVTTASVKGANCGIDAIRYGTGMYITAGDVTTPITFLDAAAYDNDVTRRWGVLTFLGGTAYELQGAFGIGIDNTLTAAYAYFDDSNKVITIVDTPHSTSTFTYIDIDGTNTVVNWANISIVAAGAVNKGAVYVENTTVVMTATGCAFSGMDSFFLKSGCTFDGCTWRDCFYIDQQGATITGCVIADSPDTQAVISDNLDVISYTEFVSAGTGHAIELAAATAGNSYTLAGCTFTGYASSDGSTGNEAIYNNSGGAVTINITGGGSTPSVRNSAGSTTTIISGSVTVTLTVQDSAGNKISGASTMIAADSGGPFPYQAAVSMTASGTTVNVTHTGHGLATNDKILMDGTGWYQINGIWSISVTDADHYSFTIGQSLFTSPTGVVTFVVLSGTTDVNGQVTMSRVFPNDQKVYGWARKSSGSPYYKTGPVSGTVSQSTGAALTSLLVKDE